MNLETVFWIAASVALVLAIFSGVMESRRSRRREFDEVGWVPWRGIQVMGFFAALAFAILALHA